jgi:hypothetical protein
MPGTDRIVLYNAKLTVNGVDLSDHLDTVTLGPFSTEALPAAGMGEVQNYACAGNLDVGSVDANFFQDFAAAKVHATIMPLWSGKVLHDIIVQPDSASRSATNPGWSGKAFVSSYTPFTGKRGAIVMSPVKWTPSGVWTQLTS